LRDGQHRRTVHQASRCHEISRMDPARPRSSGHADFTRIVTILKLSTAIDPRLRRRLRGKEISRQDLFAALDALCQTIFQEQEEEP
jgi:hypothetical protein